MEKERFKRLLVRDVRLFFSFVVSQRNSSCFQRRFLEFHALKTRTTLSSGTYQNVAKKFKLPGHPRLKAMAKYSCVEHFLKVYQAKDVTPYMHALCYHVPEFLSLYQNIAYYTQQGLEKYNNRASKDFFRSTNHKGVDALKQLFLKKNRIQFLEAAGYERVKNTYKCNNCSNKGHNIKTCTSSCKNCPAPICCAHLVKEGGKWIPRCQLQY